MNRCFLSVVCLLSVWVDLCAYTISGYVSDVESGERLIGASVYDSVSGHGTITNSAGFYTLSLPDGHIGMLRATYVGYGLSGRHEVSESYSLNFMLKSANTLQEVMVLGHQSVSAPENVQMSAIEVPVSQILGIPAIGGEVDVLKAIQLLPGVQSGGEGNAGLYVRGGGQDENLIMLDGAPLYNVNHALGMFSVFNADAIKNVTLYKGNFPARFGSRLSSVIDVRQKDGNNTFWHGGVSVGLIASKLNLEGPIFTKSQLDSLRNGYQPHAKTTFNISARRTYFDLFFAPVMAAITSDGGMPMLAGYYFYDVNAKVSHTFSENDRLSVSVYNGADVEYMSMNEKWESERMKMGVRTSWGNALAAVDWQHKISGNMFLYTQMHYTGYYSKLRQSMFSEDVETNTSFNQGMSYNSMINDVSALSQLEYTPNQHHQLVVGLSYTYHYFKPSVEGMYVYEQTEGVCDSVNMTSGGGLLHGHELAAFAEDSWAPNSWFKMNYGLRFSMYGINGKLYPSVEPRLGLRFLLHKDVAFKLSYSYMSQYVHLLTSSQLSLPTDLWVPVTDKIAPMRSAQVAAGLSYNLLNQLEISVEGYYKRSKNLIEYKEGASFFGNSTDWQEKVSMGIGWSYGVEFLIQRKVGPVTGWIGYTWSKSMRQFNDINLGKPFHSKYEREHDLSITLQYQITPRVDVAATWVYGTGTRGTLITQSYYDPNDINYVEYFSERNGFVLPDYHRLDLAFNFHFPHKLSTKGKKGMKTGYHGRGGWLRDAEHVLNVSCYNVYCHMNPMYVEASVYENKMYMVSLFPILPSISYIFKF